MRQAILHSILLGFATTSSGCVGFGWDSMSASETTSRDERLHAVVDSAERRAADDDSGGAGPPPDGSPSARPRDPELLRLARLLGDVESALREGRSGRPPNETSFGDGSGSSLVGTWSTISLGDPDVAGQDHDLAPVVMKSAVGSGATTGELARDGGSWRAEVDQARRRLRAEISALPEDEPSRIRLEDRLRLLDLVAGQGDSTDGVQRPGDEEHDVRDRYWNSIVRGLAVLLDENDDAGAPRSSGRRGALASRHFRDARRHLASAGALELDDLRFCREVVSFGVRTEFARAEFRPDQEVLLYVRVENVAADHRDGEFRTELQGSFEVFDERGARVASRLLPLDKQVTSFYRRDYFIAYRVYVPRNLRPGRHTLVLTVEDRVSGGLAHASVDFRLVP